MVVLKAIIIAKPKPILKKASFPRLHQRALKHRARRKSHRYSTTVGSSDDGCGSRKINEAHTG